MPNRLGRVALLTALFALAAVPAAPARDATVTSFDGTRIALHLFPAAGPAAGHRAPTVLVGPGWGGRGATHPNSATATDVGAVGLGPLRRAGYNVLTWDPRGVGASTGRAEVDSPRYEGRDVSALLDWLARQPEALRDRRGDPRAGMAGASYGGGIQLVAAAIDHRIDAIVPTIAWHSLVSSLYPHRTAKTGWAELLYLAATIGGVRVDPHISAANAEGEATGVISPPNVRFFATRGPGRLVRRIRAPTLLIQGTVDTLFTLGEATRNYRMLRAHHVPVGMLWFCGGHGACLTPAGDTGRIQRDTLHWLARYLKGRRAVHTGPRFQWLDQRGRSYHAADYPLPARRPLTGTGTGRLPLTAAGGSGPYAGPVVGSLGSAIAGTIARRAANAVDVPVRARHRALIMGTPRVRFTYRGTAPRARGRVVAQVVDDATGQILGNQVTPIPVRLDGRRHTASARLAMVTATARRGERFTVQIAAESSLFETHPAGGVLRVRRARVQLPTVAR